MTDLLRLRMISLAVATICLVIGFAVSELWEGAVLFLLVGVGGILALRRYASQLGTPLFLLMGVGAVAGAFSDALPGLMLVGFMAALAFWDLDAFYTRMRGFESGEAMPRLKKKYLRRLGVVLALGLAAGLAGLSIRINFTIGWAVLLGAIVVVCLRLALQHQIRNR